MISRPRTLFVVSLVIVAVAGIGSYAAGGTPGPSPESIASLSRVSAKGEPVVLPMDRRRADLERAGYGAVEKIGSIGERNVLRINRADHAPCYGSGRKGAAWPIGRYVCHNGPSPFPSAQNPVLDFSLASVVPGDKHAHYEQVSGIAADGVEAINVLDAAGTLLVRLPVLNNIYGASATTLGQDAAQLQAVDATGAVVATMPG